MKNIAKIMCGIIIATISITCTACTNDENEDVNSTIATESSETETIETETIETETEENSETETETEETTEEIPTNETETEIVSETVLAGPTEKLFQTVETASQVVSPASDKTIDITEAAEVEDNVIYAKDANPNEDRAMGSENVEEKSLGVSDEDYILLCNAVAYEAGSNWISTEEKAKVAEVILNRVESGSYPDTVYDVLTQKGQFSGASGYINLGDYSGKVSEDVKAAVDMALDASYDNHGYTGFWGDGRQNHFR